MKKLLIFLLCTATVFAAEKKKVTSELSGDAFLPGPQQPFRIAGTAITFYPGDSLPVREQDFPQVAGTTMTTVDGHYSIELPPGAYVIFLRVVRKYPRGNSVIFEWRLPTILGAEKQRCDLTYDTVIIRDPLTGDVLHKN